MENMIRLELLGITANQVEAGVYAVVLQEADGTRRIPIIIGASEAQSIQCRLQEIHTPRPLTHDLMVNMMRAYGLGLLRVILKKLPNGIFAADLELFDGEREITIDSRSSDAIALSVRLGAPIFTTPRVLDEAGFEPEEMSKRAVRNPDRIKRTPTESELERKMTEAVEREEYDEAARIKKELDSMRASRLASGKNSTETDK